MHVVATAGHVDHGKSSLVLALTGTDPDRFEEEKVRGLTIDLGFASTTLASGERLALVDVPGHARFIKNMLAGVGAVEACLFVVAATEGWKPQSEEHLRILELLGVTAGVVALTKVGVVDDDLRELARLDVEEHVAGSFLDGAPIVEVDSPTGHGIDDLRVALDVLVAGSAPAADRQRPRLWVDRSFAARGSGTVVTGTLTGGGLAVGDDLLVAPGPGERRVRVRGLQTLHEAQERVLPGSRVAVNLTGVAHDEVGRGDAVVRARQWRSTTVVDASLDVLGSLDHDVGRRGAYAAYIGSGEHAVRLRILGAAAIAAGGRGWVRLWLATPLPMLPGDRFVLREHGRGETVGGGEVLDVAPVLAASRARPTRDPRRVVRERGWVDVDELELLVGERLEPTLGRWVVDPEVLATVRASVASAVDAAGPLGIDVAAFDERQRAVLPTMDELVVERGRARRADATDDPLADHPYVRALEAAPFTPPDPDGVDRAELRELVRRGLVVEANGRWFAPSAVEEARRLVVDLLRAAPEGFTVSAFREAAGTSRKHAVPLLAHLDASGITLRRGDLHIGGPRLAVPIEQCA